MSGWFPTHELQTLASGCSLRLVQVCSLFLFETMCNARNDPRNHPRNPDKVHYTAGVISYGKGELAQARQRFEAAGQICTRLVKRLYALRVEQILAGLL